MEIERPEGVYGLFGNHIYFDCKCGSKTCYYKDVESKEENTKFTDSVRIGAENMVDNYKTTYEKKDRVHTFYTNLAAFVTFLDDVDFFIKEGKYNGKGLSLICEGCKGEFTFTPKLLEHPS